MCDITKLEDLMSPENCTFQSWSCLPLLEVVRITVYMCVLKQQQQKYIYIYAATGCFMIQAPMDL